VWEAGKLWVSRNFVKSRVLANGPLRLVFELEYAPYEVGASKVVETKRITVDAGRNINRFESHFKVESGARPLAAGVGIARHAGGKATFDKALGMLRSWEPLKGGESGNVGCAVLAPAESVEGQQVTELDTLLIAAVPPTGPLAYYVGFGWDKSGDFADERAWTKYAEDFARALKAPLRVSLSSAAARSSEPAAASDNWANRTCDWLMRGQPQGLGDTWEYDNGLMLRGCQQLGLEKNDARYLEYVKQSVDRLVQPDGSIKGYKLEDYTLDNLNSGKLLFSLLARATDAKERASYTKALQLLRTQLKTQPRTTDGGFWHKKIYPSQM
jgi:hypothetical protein